MTDPADSLTRALEGRYSVSGLIGRGGMADVYRAEDLRHHRQVALKVLRPDLARSIGSERFLAEIGITAGLNHPHILPLLDSGANDGYLWYTMPLVEGPSLRTELSHGPVSLARARAIVSEVSEALDYAHARDIIHRDVKPENVLLSQGHALVADFGVAKAVTRSSSGRLTATGIAIGTPGYMSPEQLAGGDRVDARSDVYGLAVCLYEMLLGELPPGWCLQSEVAAGRFSKVTGKARERLDSLPRHLEPLLVRSLSVDPSDRPPGAGVLARSLAEGRRQDLLPAAEARQIVHRAAELEASPTADQMSLGSVERLADEVGIASHHVKRAAQELALRKLASPEPGGILGHRTALSLDTVVDGSLYPELHPILLEEIRLALDDPGRLEDTLGRGLAWSSTHAPNKRRTKVMLSEQGGQTRIRISEDDPPPGSAVALAPVAALGAVLVGITGAIVSSATGSDLWATLAGLGVGGGAVTAGYTILRQRLRSTLEARATILRGLYGRLRDRLGTEGSPAELTRATPPE